jgi:hypothetical protein
MRTLLAAGAVLALLLAACSTNSGATTSPTPTEPAMPAASLGTMASAEASPVGMTCAEAFASLSASDLASISSLSGAQAALDSTIGACSTVSDWTTAAESVLPTVDFSGAEDFLRQRCAANDQLAATQICSAVSS